jgi:glutamyl-Q tRNA(Asp) synthetase
MLRRLIQDNKGVATGGGDPAMQDWIMPGFQTSAGRPCIRDTRLPPPVFRFAPSPNGLLHLGHALSALMNFDLARQSGGRFLLRMEDIDATRCRPEYEAAICEDLAWLGIAWEEPVLRQSARMAAYEAALRRLDAMGVVYAAFESRAEIARLVAERERAGMRGKESWPRDPDGAPLYPGSARDLPAAESERRIAAGDSYGLRLDVAAALALIRQGGGGPLTEPLSWTEAGAGPDGDTGTVAADPAAWGDVILARKDVQTSYHLSVVVDDAHQGVTEVVRGQDLFHATSVHRLLQAVLGLPAPRYRHHRLIRDAEGRKLSKATGATGLRELRAAGVTAGDVRGMVGL